MHNDIDSDVPRADKAEHEFPQPAEVAMPGKLLRLIYAFLGVDWQHIRSNRDRAQVFNVVFGLFLSLHFCTAKHLCYGLRPTRRRV